MAFLSHLVGPDTGLNLTDMGLVQHHHAQAALTDTATDAQRQFVIKQLLMEVKLLAVFLPFYLQLAQQAFFVHTDTHRTQFESAVNVGYQMRMSPLRPIFPFSAIVDQSS